MFTIDWAVHYFAALVPFNCSCGASEIECTVLAALCTYLRIALAEFAHKKYRAQKAYEEKETRKKIESYLSLKVEILRCTNTSLLLFIPPWV